MATKTLSKNITQAVSDFRTIKQAITDKGVEITSGTPTSKYGEKIREIPSGTQPPINGFMPTEFDNDGFPTKGMLYGLTTVPDYYFYGSSSGGYFYYLNGIEFEKEIMNIGNYAFYYFKSLTTADFPKVISVGDYAFYQCNSLTTVDFPSANGIGYSAFFRCPLNTVDFPLVTSIGGHAFQYCYALTTADFPKVASIGNYAFQNCSNLKTLILRSSSVCELGGSYVFSGTPIASGNGYIYVTSALINDYKTATNWSTYSSRFRAIEDYPNICG